MKHLFVCDCGSPEHQFIVEQLDHGYLALHVHLRPQLPWRRVITGLKYVLGKGGYSFEEVLLQQSGATKLRDVIDQFLKETANEDVRCGLC